MNALKNLGRSAWSRYTWVALVFGVFCFSVMVLEGLEHMPDRLVSWVLQPTVTVGFAGWLLDAAYGNTSQWL